MENTYKLIIEDTRGGESAGGQSGTSSTGQASGAAADKSQNTLAKTVAKVWSASALVRTGVEAGEQIISRDMGNERVQAKISAVNSLVTQGVGVGLAFAVGGILGGVAALATVGISYGREVEQYNYNKRWESYSLQRTYERAGPSFNRSRLKY